MICTTTERVQRRNLYWKQYGVRVILKLQGRETHGTRFTASSVEAAARYLKKNAGAKGDTKALTKLLSGFSYIATGELTWENVVRRQNPLPIGSWIMWSTATAITTKNKDTKCAGRSIMAAKR